MPICLLTFFALLFHTVLNTFFCLLGHPVYFVCPYHCPDFFLQKIFLLHPPPHKNQMVAPLCIQRLNGGALVAHKKLFHNQPALYPYLRSEIKTTSIASGQYGYSVDDFFQGLVPNKLIVGLVSSVAYTGDYGKKPFFFQPYDCSSLGLYIDGQSYPSQPLQPYYQADQFVDCYRTLTHFRKDINVSRGRLLHVCARCGPLLPIQYKTKRSLPSGAQVYQTLTRRCQTNYVCHLPRDSSH